MSEPIEEPEVVEDAPKEEGAQPRFWTREQVANFLDITISALRRLEKKGVFAPVKDRNGINWFDPAEVEAYAIRREQAENSEAANALPPPHQMRTTEIAQRRSEDGVIETRRRVIDPLPPADPTQNIAMLQVQLMKHLENKETALQTMLDMSLNALSKTNEQLQREVQAKDAMIEKLVLEKFAAIEVTEEMLTKKHERELLGKEFEAKQKRLDQGFQTGLSVLKTLAPAVMLQLQGDKEGAKKAAESAAANMMTNGLGVEPAPGSKIGQAASLVGFSKPTGAQPTKDEIAQDIAAADHLFDHTPEEELKMLMGFLKEDQVAALGQLYENYQMRKSKRASASVASSKEEAAKEAS